MLFSGYLAIVHPLKSMRYRTVSNAFAICIVLWVCCLIIMMPCWLYARVQIKAGNTKSCVMKWPKENFLSHQWFWFYFELTLGFILPIIIMSMCYIALVRNLVFMRQNIQEQNRRPIKKVTLMVFIVTIVFVACWTPYHIVKYVNDSIMTTLHETHVIPTHRVQLNATIFLMVANSLTYISSCINPFIYAISSRNFRKYNNTFLRLCMI